MEICCCRDVKVSKIYRLTILFYFFAFITAVWCFQKSTGSAIETWSTPRETPHAMTKTVSYSDTERENRRLYHLNTEMCVRRGATRQWRLCCGTKNSSNHSDNFINCLNSWCCVTSFNVSVRRYPVDVLLLPGRSDL